MLFLPIDLPNKFASQGGCCHMLFELSTLKRDPLLQQKRQGGAGSGGGEDLVGERIWAWGLDEKDQVLGL